MPRARGLSLRQVTSEQYVGTKFAYKSRGYCSNGCAGPQPVASLGKGTPTSASYCGRCIREALQFMKDAAHKQGAHGKPVHDSPPIREVWFLRPGSEEKVGMAQGVRVHAGGTIEVSSPTLLGLMDRMQVVVQIQLWGSQWATRGAHGHLVDHLNPPVLLQDRRYLVRLPDDFPDQGSVHMHILEDLQDVRAAS